MTGICRMMVEPGGKIFCYEVCEGDTYETALLSLRINPDTVLILYHGVSLPQDKPIDEDEVEIVLTSLTGCGIED
jgi:sulfur carrier protein ThiS